MIKPINTELNHFINRNNLQPTPKRANHHPQTSLPFKENQPLINNLNRSPARSTSRKILNSKEDSLYSIASNDSYGYNQAKIGNRQLLSAGNAKTMIRSMEIIT